MNSNPDPEDNFDSTGSGSTTLRLLTLGMFEIVGDGIIVDPMKVDKTGGDGGQVTESQHRTTSNWTHRGKHTAKMEIEILLKILYSKVVLKFRSKGINPKKLPSVECGDFSKNTFFDILRQYLRKLV